MRKGYRNFIAVGGDGTGSKSSMDFFLLLHGWTRGAWILPLEPEIPSFATSANAGPTMPRGNPTQSTAAVRRHSFKPRWRPLYYINTLNIRFAADVATLTNRHLKRPGRTRLSVGVLVSLARLGAVRFRYALMANGTTAAACSSRSANSKYTAVKMMLRRKHRSIAARLNMSTGTDRSLRPGAKSGNLFDGSHIRHHWRRVRTATRIEFDIQTPVDVVVDGEVLTLEVESLKCSRARLM